MKRYFTQTGSHPSIEACVHIAGPQAEDQIPKEICDLLDRPGIQRVAVFYNHGAGDRVDVIAKMPEEAGS